MLIAGLLASSLMVGSCSDDDEMVFEGTPEISVTKAGNVVDAIDFGSYSESVMLTLESNAPWTISCSDNSGWLQLSNISGDPTTGVNKKPRYIKLSVSPIGESDTRTCTVTFSAAGAVKNITVTQRGVNESVWENSFAANRNMGVGINLYNTLDAVGDWFDPDDIVACETCWGQPLATQGWFDAVAASGFRAVRVPVTWWLHMDENDVVKEPWMNRVEEVVNYALNAGLYCILNVHHDTGDGGWLCADKANIETISARYVKLWTQIANRFNKYDHKLLFEGYNEMLDEKNSWVEPSADGYEALNMIAQTFVNTVRATGGNNEHRNLIVNTYGGGGSATRLNNMAIPKDQVPGHLLVQVHNYTPARFSNLDESLNDLDDKDMPAWSKEFEKELGDELELLIAFSNKHGIPVVIGECGAYDRIPDAEKAKYGEFISTYSHGRASVSVFFWGQLIDRTNYNELYPLFIDGLLKGLNN